MEIYSERANKLLLVPNNKHRGLKPRLYFNTPDSSNNSILLALLLLNQRKQVYINMLRRCNSNITSKIARLLPLAPPLPCLP